MTIKRIAGSLLVVLAFSLYLPVTVFPQNENRVSKFIQELKDKNPGVRGKAAEALGAIKDARAVEPLIAALSV